MCAKKFRASYVTDACVQAGHPRPLRASACARVRYAPTPVLPVRARALVACEIACIPLSSSAYCLCAPLGGTLSGARVRVGACVCVRVRAPAHDACLRVVWACSVHVA